MGTMKIIAFDCDSTLSAIEGIDELARSRGPAVFAQIEAMTNDAMNGRLPVEAVFGRRLEIIQPRRADADAVALAADAAVGCSTVSRLAWAIFRRCKRT